jgi:hypothetical protein
MTAYTLHYGARVGYTRSVSPARPRAPSGRSTPFECSGELRGNITRATVPRARASFKKDSRGLPSRMFRIMLTVNRIAVCGRYGLLR